MSLRRSQSGFSLVELLVVASIIILMSTMAVANYKGVKKSSANSEAKINAMKIVTAIQQYRNNKGEFPISRCNGYSPVCLKYSFNNMSNRICRGSNQTVTGVLIEGNTNQFCAYDEGGLPPCSWTYPVGSQNIDEQLKSYLGASLSAIPIASPVTNNFYSGWDSFIYLSHAASDPVTGRQAGAYLAWFKGNCEIFKPDECDGIRLSSNCNGDQITYNGCAIYLGKVPTDYTAPPSCINSDALRWF